METRDIIAGLLAYSGAADQTGAAEMRNAARQWLRNNAAFNHAPNTPEDYHRRLTTAANELAALRNELTHLAYFIEAQPDDGSELADEIYNARANVTSAVDSLTQLSEV